ncbi:MAG TPA: HWE histidine kinase domain-containing protein, partial [Beijerinckiaceae bacterium]|nr:HWE histidine kinase domain-containing protein [Beijerinckiaceae bacterium]
IRSFTPAAVENIFSLIPSDRGRPLADIVNRLDKAADLPRLLRTAIERGRSFEQRMTAQEGNLHYLMRILPYRMSESQAYGALITFVDITSVIRAEDHEKFLVSELNHRVQDMLGTVISITTDTRKRSKTLDDFELSDQLLERFHALARTHEVLSKAGWVDTPLADLLSAEIAPYIGQGRRKARAQGPNILLVPKAALALGVALHELAAYSASDGALSAPRGRVDVEWQLRGNRVTQMLELSWSERGAPPIVAGKKPAFDLAYVKRGVQAELAAKTKLEFRDEGLRCTIRIPAAGNIGANRRKD